MFMCFEYSCTAVKSCRFLIFTMYFVWFFSKLDNMYHRVLPGLSLDGCRELIDDLKRLYDYNFIIQPY